jgi:hypothetical protein
MTEFRLAESFWRVALPPGTIPHPTTTMAVSKIHSVAMPIRCAPSVSPPINIANPAAYIPNDVQLPLPAERISSDFGCGRATGFC